MNSDLFQRVHGSVICNACNVLPSFNGEHRCFGAPCACLSPLCRLQRQEVTLTQLIEEDKHEACERYIK